MTITIFREESTSARSRRCFTQQDVASFVSKSKTLEMADNKTWFEKVFFDILQPGALTFVCTVQVPMVNKGAQITAIALNPTRQLLAFTERGERPLLVMRAFIRIYKNYVPGGFWPGEEEEGEVAAMCWVPDTGGFLNVPVLIPNSTCHMSLSSSFLHSGCFPCLLPRLQVPVGPGGSPGSSAGLLLLGERKGGWEIVWYRQS